MNIDLKKIIKRTRLYKLYFYLFKAGELEKKYNEEHRKLSYILDHIELKDLKPARGYLRARQRNIISFAQKVFFELKPLDIHPFMIGGNLIGWLRHGGFVPWDDDLDFGIIRSDFEKLVQYAQSNWVVFECPVQDSEQQKWIDDVTHEYAGKNILFIYAAHIQISCGFSSIDRRTVDFFVYDYFNEEYSFEEHNDYVKQIKIQLERCTDERERLSLVRKALRMENQTVDYSSKIYFGMDSCEPYLRTFNESWIHYETIYPLKEIEYEGIEVFIPHYPEQFIMYEYPTWKELPNDFGRETHDYWKKYYRNKLVTVEFYLVDAFEIEHFLPLYYFFRKRGIYAIYIAEPPKDNVSGEWFNYDEAISILNEKELEYSCECYPDADYAFTTQRADCLKKYKNKKINISYGCGLIKYQFAFSYDSIKGFDYKFVHGPFSKELCMRNLTKSEWEKYKNNIMLMGYPKFTVEKEINTKNIIAELGIHTSKVLIGYLPTWGKTSCTQDYDAVMKKIKNKFYIITKPHHCTERLHEELENRKAIEELSDLVLPSNYDIEKMLAICDIVICNAESGVSLECGWIKQDIKIVMLTKEKNISESFFPEIKDVAITINNPEDFVGVVNAIYEDDPYIGYRINFLNEVFGNREKNYLDDIYRILFRLEKEK